MEAVDGQGRGHCRRSGSSGSGKSTCYCHLLLVIGVVIVVAAVSDFQAISGCSISWCRSSSCVEIADSIIATTALVVVMSRCLISTELLVALLLLVVVLLHFVLRLGAIVVIVVVLHIRLRLHGGIVLNGGSRFGLAADLLLTTATTQMLDLRVVDELRFRGGQLRAGIIGYCLALCVSVHGNTHRKAISAGGLLVCGQFRNAAGVRQTGRFTRCRGGRRWSCMVDGIVVGDVLVVDRKHISCRLAGCR